MIARAAVLGGLLHISGCANLDIGVEVVSSVIEQISERSFTALRTSHGVIDNVPLQHQIDLSVAKSTPDFLRDFKIVIIDDVIGLSGRDVYVLNQSEFTADDFKIPFYWSLHNYSRSDATCRRLATITRCQKDANSIRPSLSFIRDWMNKIKASGNPDLDLSYADVGADLRFPDASRLSDSSLSGHCCAPIDRQRISDQSNGPDANAYTEQGGERCDPLCVRIRRRSVGFPETGPYDWVVLPGLAVLGVLVSILLIGWITKSREGPNEK